MPAMWEVIHKTCLEGFMKNPVYWSEWQLGQLAKNPSIMAECNIQHTCMLDNMTNIFFSNLPAWSKQRRQHQKLAQEYLDIINSHVFK